ncbi:MAG: DNA polymerase/3'-5' exonuclease PolX [Chloroflexota bacterium]
MNNADVAAALTEVAELLELKNESGFRIRAYQNAARAIGALTEDVRDLATRGTLTNVKGIGGGLAERIEELLESGHMQYLDDLRNEFPEGVRALLNVPGVGPSLARRVYHDLGVENTDQLRAAAQDGRLAGLSGLGEKSAQNVLRGLERVNKRDNRISIGRAVPLVQELMGQLRDTPLQNLAAAGSLRRWSPTIGDIDLMATSTEPEAVMETFIKLRQVAHVLAHGGTKSSILTDNGIQVDLRIVPQEAFGALLQHFTGSKDHNVELREYALHRGLSLNEYGIMRVDTSERQSFSDEKSFYTALDLAYIEPELRQGAGEIEAARTNALPHLVEVADIRGDLHVHSAWSDGAFPLEAMAHAAQARGYEYMAITDHSGGIGVAGGLRPDRLLEQLELVREVNTKLDGFHILAGSEVDIKRDGTLDFADDVLGQLDWVIASVHSAFNQSREDMTARMVRAIQNPYVHAIAHPTGRLIGKREPYDVDLEAIFSAAAECNTALEINSFPERLDLVDTHARRAKDLGVMLVINTDAHAPVHFDNVCYGVAMARRAWAEAHNVLNTRSYDDLIKWLKSDGRSP